MHNNAQTITNLNNHYFHIWVTVAKNYSKYAWLLFQHWPHKRTLTIQSQEVRMHILNSDCSLFFFFIQFLSWLLANQQLSVCVHAQSCLILCNPMDCSTQVSSVHGIFQARILEWIAISFSRKSQPRDQTRIFYISYWQASSLPAEPIQQEFSFVVTLVGGKVQAHTHSLTVRA